MKVGWALRLKISISLSLAPWPFFVSIFESEFGRLGLLYTILLRIERIAGCVFHRRRFPNVLVDFHFFGSLENSFPIFCCLGNKLENL